MAKMQIRVSSGVGWLYSIRALAGVFAFGVCVSLGAQSDNITAQIGNLKSPDAAIRANAADALGKFKDPRGFKPLIAALKDDDPQVRMMTVLALMNLHDRRAVGPLTDLLGDTDRDVQMVLGLALGSLGDTRAIPPLVAALKYNKHAAQALDQLGAASVPALIEALKDPDREVRANAVGAFGGIQDPRTLEPLLAAAKDPAAEVREQAIIALSRSSDPRAIEALIAALKDPSSSVRATAAGMMSRTKSERVIPPLIAALDDPDAEVQSRAIYSIGRVGGPLAKKELIALIQDRDSKDRWGVMNALVQMNDPHLTQFLADVFADRTDKRDVRLMAAEGLRGRHDPEAVGPLIETLKDPDSWIRTTAAEILGRMKDPRAAKALAEAMNNPNEQDKTPYSEALRQIEPPSVASLIEEAKQPETCEKAIRGLARSKDPRAFDVLLDVLRTPYPGRAIPYGGIIGGMVALGGTGVRQVGMPPTCYDAAVRGLAASGDPRAIGPLIEYMRSGPFGRDSVPYALRRFGPLAVPGLIALFQDENEMTRTLAAQTLMSTDDSKAKTALIAALKKRNLAVLAGGYSFYVALGQPGSEEVLAEALEQRGDQRMAEYFLNCGNFKLEEAARAWAARHYPQMRQTMSGVTWGQPLEHRRPRQCSLTKEGGCK